MLVGWGEEELPEGEGSQQEPHGGAHDGREVATESEGAEHHEVEEDTRVGATNQGIQEASPHQSHSGYGGLAGGGGGSTRHGEGPGGEDPARTTKAHRLWEVGAQDRIGEEVHPVWFDGEGCLCVIFMVQEVRLNRIIINESARLMRIHQSEGAATKDSDLERKNGGFQKPNLMRRDVQIRHIPRNPRGSMRTPTPIRMANHPKLLPRVLPKVHPKLLPKHHQKPRPKLWCHMQTQQWRMSKVRIPKCDHKKKLPRKKPFLKIISTRNLRRNKPTEIRWANELRSNPNKMSICCDYIIYAEKRRSSPNPPLPCKEKSDLF